MKAYSVEIAGLKVIELDIWKDSRGFFIERFQEQRFKEAGLPYQFLQDNHSHSYPGVIRGMHFQSDPAQGKLVGALSGKIWDVVVDIRPSSPSFGKQFSLELSQENGILLWIPAGFAHGFCTLGDQPADVLYKVDAPYNAKSDSGILWSDPDLNISWPVKSPIVSEKDQKQPRFRDWKLKWGIPS